MKKYLGIDIGGSWIKGAIIDEQYDLLSGEFQINKVKSPLHANVAPNELIDSLKELIVSFGLDSDKIGGIAISTAGIVNYHGTKITKAAEHLNVLKTELWKTELEKKLNCEATILNDADATAIGLAELNYLEGNKTIGIMPIGTGLGFSVWRNGRRWRPGKSLTLLGSISLPEGNYDNFASASKLAENDPAGNLINVLKEPVYLKVRRIYLRSLVKVINSAAILYNLDEVIICGGLASAAVDSGYPLEEKLNNMLKDLPPELDKPVKAIVATEGNKLQLIGAITLAKAETEVTANKIETNYKALHTEIPYDKNLRLEQLETPDIIETFWEAEQEAGLCLKVSLPVISEVADRATRCLKEGGRLIYVGAGTSGRIAAMDAVEIPCTYGFPEDRIITLISGGIADAAIEIESDFEEDASSIPEMLLLNIQKNDVVVGISASGSAYYVQSALVFAKYKKALTVQILVNQPKTKPSFCDYMIPLNSGDEIVAGSTRMKAGTATKKVLNFLSSAIMINLGKVVGPYMIDVACLNNKLVGRATNILNILYGLDKDEAFQKLDEANMELSKAIRKINEE